MRNSCVILIVFCFSAFNTISQNKLDEILPVRGVCIAAPAPDGVQPFIDWIKNDLVPRKD